MNATLPTAEITPSAQGKKRMLQTKGEPFLLADWQRTLMLHYAVDPAVLQPFVPFPLDTWEGKAYISLVAFTMKGMHPRMGGWLSALLMKPIATHEFLNVRTYVIHRGEPGIHFLAEWLPNKLSVAIGGLAFGLPYKLGRFNYQHDHEQGKLSGRVTAFNNRGTLTYEGTTPPTPSYAPAKPGTLTEFLMERYTAFTCWLGFKRLFRVWHRPWQQCEADITVSQNSLSALTGRWADQAQYIGANYSPGAQNVWMSRPLFC